MDSVTFFQQLERQTCAFCGHNFKNKEEDLTYSNVCVDCLEVLDEE